MATRADYFQEEVSRSFEEEWPELARRLDRFLAAKGVEVWLRGDIAQETAARLYRRWWELDHSRPLWNLVVTIALRVLIDEQRKNSRVELVADAPQTQVDDVETRALGRVHLGRTHSALKKLGSDQRRVLLAEIGEAAALNGNRNRINVLRLRARNVLKAELGPWAPAGIALRARSIRAAIERRMAEWGRDAHVVAASVASVAVAASLMIVAPGLHDAKPGLYELGLRNPEVFAVNEVRPADFYPRIGHIRRSQPRDVSKAENRARRHAPGVFRHVDDGLRKADHALREGMRRTNDALNETNRALREGDRQLRKGEKTVRRKLNDLP